MIRSLLLACSFALLLISGFNNTAFSQSFLQINSSSTSDIFQVEAMENNDLIIRGTYRGTAQFGSIKKYSKEKVTYIARVTPTGVFKWVTEVDLVISDLALTDEGIFALSVFKTKNKEARTSSSEMKLYKFDYNGNKLSLQSICTLSGSLYDPYLKGVLDNDGNPLACLHWVKEKPIKINRNTLKKNLYGAICYIQYDKNGKEIWRQFTEGGQDSFTDMHIDAMNFDSDNNFHVIGVYGKEAIFGDKKLTTKLVFKKGTGAVDLYYHGSFLLKISPKGTIEKIKTISQYQCEYTSIAFGKNGNLFLGGYYKGNGKNDHEKTPIVGGKELPGAFSMNESSFVAGLNSDWESQWNYALSSERENRVSTLTVDNNRLITTGFWKRKLFDGKNTYTSTENEAPYKSEGYQQLFDLNGKHLATKVYQGKGSEWPKHILNNNNQVITYGSFREEMKIGSSKFTSKGTYQNAFIILPKLTTSETTTASNKESETSDSAPPAAGSSYVKGQHVIANWKGKGKYYGCIITSIKGNNVSLQFDDDDSENTTTAFLRKDWVVGDKVECNWKAKGTFYKCSIISIKGKQFEVLYTDGQKEWTTSRYMRSN